MCTLFSPASDHDMTYHTSQSYLPGGRPCGRREILSITLHRRPACMPRLPLHHRPPGPTSCQLQCSAKLRASVTTLNSSSVRPVLSQSLQRQSTVQITHTRIGVSLLHAHHLRTATEISGARHVCLCTCDSVSPSLCCWSSQQPFMDPLPTGSY